MSIDRLRDAIAQVDGLRCTNTEGMLSWESAAKIADALEAWARTQTCNVDDHVSAARTQALGEVEQLLEARWQSAWEEWGVSADADEKGFLSLKTRLLWVAMNQRLGDLEAVREIAR